MIIGAGLGENNNIVKASKKVDFEVLITKSEDELIHMLLNNEVDAAIRGSLNAGKIMKVLKEEYGRTIYRVSLLDIDGHKFFLGPVGIDEGDNFKDKLNIIKLGAEFLSMLGITPRIGVISGARLQDIGRSQKVDVFIDDSKKLIETIKDKYLIKHYLIEESIKDKANLILAPDGISGNLIFRTLVFLGSTRSYGAVTLGIDKIFMDTSRSQSIDGYIRALEFSYYLARLKSRRKNGSTKTSL